MPPLLRLPALWRADSPAWGDRRAILAFRFLLPIDPARRLRSILVAIVHDLNTMAAADSLLLVKKCRARTHHRVLRMIANARKLDHDLSAVVEGGLATLAIGRYLQRLREAGTSDGISLVASGAIRETTVRLAAVTPRPGEILSVLEDVSKILCEVMEATHKDYGSSVQTAVPAKIVMHNPAAAIAIC